MGLIVLPTVLYSILHILGWYYPARLWGTDQLYYYPLPVFAFFVLIVAATIAISAKEAWILRVDQILASQLQRCHREFCTSSWFKVLLVLLFIFLAYLFRDRSHFLGDSAKWIAVLEHALSGATQTQGFPGYHNRLSIPGFEYINVQQALDLFIRFQTYRLGHHLWNWTPGDTYEWTSCLAGGLYALILWKISSFLNARTAQRLTLFIFLLTLGISQLFFGYGESYTLVTMASALYVLYSLRCLQGHCSLIYPTLGLLLAVALHLMALSLLPSWLYLLWRDRGRLGAFIRRPQIHLPLLVVGGLLGLYVFVEFYRPMCLPLWTVEEEGQYALLSLPHITNLINEVLLISPFGLIWGIAFLVSRKASTPSCRFLGWASLGTSILIAVHYISMGGRDWDLMAFPGLFYSLWGIQSLELTSQSNKLFRQLRWAVLPLMILHTALWIGINSSPDRAVERLGNLMHYTPNQGLHYRAFTLGHYYLNIRKDDYSQAVRYFREALNYAPVDDLDHINQYRQFLATALAKWGGRHSDEGRFSQAIEAYQEAIRLQPNRWETHYYLGIEYLDRGQLQEGTRALEKAIRLQPDFADAYSRLGIVYHKLGREQESVTAFKKVIQLEPDNAQAHFNLGMSFLLNGDRDSALEQYEAIRHLDADIAENFLNFLKRTR